MYDQVPERSSDRPEVTWDTTRGSSIVGPASLVSRLLTHLLACPVPDRGPFFLQTLVNRSERLAIGWGVRAPFPSGPALHPEVRYAFESGWLPFMQSPFGPKVYPKYYGWVQEEEEEEVFITKR